MRSLVLKPSSRKGFSNLYLRTVDPAETYYEPIILLKNEDAYAISGKHTGIHFLLGDAPEFEKKDILIEPVEDREPHTRAWQMRIGDRLVTGRERNSFGDPGSAKEDVPLRLSDDQVQIFQELASIKFPPGEPDWARRDVETLEDIALYQEDLARDAREMARAAKQKYLEDQGHKNPETMPISVTAENDSLTQKDIDLLKSHIDWLRGDHDNSNPWLADTIDALLTQQSVLEPQEQEAIWVIRKIGAPGIIRQSDGGWIDISDGTIRPEDMLSTQKAKDIPLTMESDWFWCRADLAGSKEVLAELHSDDNVISLRVDIRPWLKEAGYGDIDELDAEAWGYGEAHDYIAYHLDRIRDPGAVRLFDYLSLAPTMSFTNDTVGFGLITDEDDVLDWLKDNKPAILPLKEDGLEP